MPAQGRFRWTVRAACCALATAAVLACAPFPPSPATAAAARSADQFLAVDCLLPGQIRKLGRSVTYLSARRAVKTTASDCEIRGGEYVAYDRANYATALQVWLPLAEQGDAAAQTYVGEIYEKGLGVPPDYAQAALWYRKAAEQGNARAQTNLGALYEQGLGVPRDRVQALNWYRRAAGLGGDQLAFTASLQQLEAERQAASRQATLSRQEAAALRKQLQDTQRQLDASRRRLEAAQQELERSRRELQRPAPAPSPPPASGANRELEHRLAEQQKLLGQQQQEMARLRQETERQQELLGKLQAARQAAPADSQERTALQGQIDTLQKALVKALAQLEASRRELDEQRKAQQQVQAQFEQQVRAAGSQQSAEAERLRQQLSARDSELAKAREQLAALETSVQSYQKQLEELRQGQTVRGSDSGSAATAPADTAAALPASLDFGRYYALVIGNNRYRNLPNLETAAVDAQAVAELLRSRYGFTTRVLLDADRYAILSALNEFRAQLTEQDNFLLYYAGHGELDRANARGHWLPVDAAPDDTTNWISNVQVTDILNAMSAKHVMVIADSCYSGTLARAVTTSIEGGRSADKRRAWLTLMINTRSRTVLTSGGLKPVLDSGGGNHSVFARAFLEVLQNNSDVLEGPLLYQQVAKRVKAAAARLNVDQDPQYAPIKFAGDLGAPFFFRPVL